MTHIAPPGAGSMLPIPSARAEVAQDRGGRPLDGDPVLAAGAIATPAQSEESDESAGPSARAYRPGYELVAEQILQLIAESQLRPGDRLLTENELASRLGTSRTVVREAVKILSAIGR